MSKFHRFSLVFRKTCSLALAGFGMLSLDLCGSAEDTDSAVEGPSVGLSSSEWQGIRDAYESSRYSFMPSKLGLKAYNPGQQWITTFDERGFVSRPQEGEWEWGLELKRYGFGGVLRPVDHLLEREVNQNRLNYKWDNHVQEWFVNDLRGLEHGFTVVTRPEVDADTPDATLDFFIGIRGKLRPEVSDDRRGVRFLNEQGALVLTYAGLKVWDAHQRILPARFERVEDGLRLMLDEREAVYPITIDPIAQQAYLKASNSGDGDQFGYSVAISGDTVVVGAPTESSGANGVNGDEDDDDV